MDLIGATEAGLKFTAREFDSFNRQLVEQIKPHLDKLWLADALLKFTGDGWLLMVHGAEKVPALCCLAIVMANRFQDEMSHLTKIATDRIPPLRLAICSGQDTYVVLPDGRKDWVGDSARRATRASGYCFPNEILIDEPVRYIVFRDFHLKPVDVKQRPPEYQPKRMEEDFPVHVLGEPKPEVVEDSEAPEYFVYTLSVIGKMKEAEIVAQRVSERLGDEVSKLGIAEIAARQGILRSWNRLIASLPDYSNALEMLKSIRDARLAPDVVTYDTLMNKAPDYDAAKAWVDKMREEGLQPNVVTYNTLINKAPDYDAAKAWVDKMREEGIQPNVATYSTLFSKDLSGKPADEIVEWYLAQKYHPDEPIQAAIAAYRKIHLIDQALRLALDYPHLQVARKLIRKHQEEALSYFRGISDHDPEHPNADYALGVAFMEVGRELEAQPHLRKALKLAKEGPRKVVIKEWLRQIDRKLAQKQSVADS
jgi:tetratricopeptide (TPR) repeat protein